MTRYYYKKSNRQLKKKFLHLFSLLLIFAGLIIVIYVFYPLVLWQIYFAPALASSNFTSSIPKTNIVSSSQIGSLFRQAGDIISGVDYTNARNWFPGFKPSYKTKSKVFSYTISIPKLGIKDAIVSNADYNLAAHLVSYGSDITPPESGSAIIFGHSTLPQLFNPKNYKTIFANLYQLKNQDIIYVNESGISYAYKIFNINVVDPDDTSIFAQDYNDSYLTIVTCTPPGTTWKRLIIKARLEKI